MSKFSKKKITAVYSACNKSHDAFWCSIFYMPDALPDYSV